MYKTSAAVILRYLLSVVLANFFFFFIRRRVRTYTGDLAATRLSTFERDATTKYNIIYLKRVPRRAGRKKN